MQKKHTHTQREEGEDKCRKGERKGARRDVEKKRMLHVTRFGFAALTTLRKTLTRLAVRETRPGNFANRKQLKRRETERERKIKNNKASAEKKRNMENKMKSGRQSSLVSIAVKDKSA